MISLKLNDKAAESHFLLIEKLLTSRISNVIKNGIRKKSGKIFVVLKPNKDLLNYLNFLLISGNLKKLITAKPDGLIKIISDLNKNYTEFLDSKSESNRILYNIFVSSCYDTKKFSKHDFITIINLDTCPYCNRNYIYYLAKKDEIKPQIDHFFPKSKYPFFAMSFYNLIPSCQTCNGLEVKGEKDPVKLKITNPYQIMDTDFTFSYKILTSGIISSLLDKNSVKVELTSSLTGNLEVFKLKELYELHSDHVVELVFKSKIKYSDTYRKYLKKYREKGIFFSDNEVDRMILGNYTNIDDIHKRPFSKLYQDIGLDLGLIKKK
ncbi:hypothetical protein NZ698_14830 [Chryseobacterium sp. PBS4-4]|uniref:HNH nuclease domain-containing protein n=1 Tax=Chryseobacterium edaphi TaxID=2976532 RepID=A0ABT2W930_9FLAO|nr:hypothetical protein [Chryseobacterium edaphi]MCU7618473.1 hypothetical protein [Chryseobacterium edaphi]